MPLHVFIVHFHAALVVTGAAADLLGLATGRTGLRRAAGALLVLGAAVAVLAFLTGGGALQAVYPRVGVANTHVESHAQWGGAGVWPVAILGVLRLLWRDRLFGAYGWALAAASILSAILVVAITLSGLTISHG